MPTQDAMPQPTIPVRGQVQKTFVDRLVLAGYTDKNHFLMLVGEYLSTLNEEEQKLLLNKLQAAQNYVSTLQPKDISNVELGTISNTYISELESDTIFRNAFGNTSHRFSYVNPSNIIALQPWIVQRRDTIPTDENELMKFAFPKEWDVPAEINFIPPQGPIQILSSSPLFSNLAIEFDTANGKVQLGPPKHLNLIQISHFQDKYYLRNGYHRVADAVASGIERLPALVIDAFNPTDVQLTGPAFFGFGYISKLPRPPLVADFHTQAAVATKVRERRYGMIVSLDVKQINIGI